MPKTGADLVAYWQQEELCGYRADISNSQTYARAIRDKAEKLIRIGNVQRRIGEAKGMVKIAPDFDDMPEDWMAHFK